MSAMSACDFQHVAQVKLLERCPKWPHAPKRPDPIGLLGASKVSSVGRVIGSPEVDDLLVGHFLKYLARVR